jgi:hypothetical protein
MVMAFVMVPRIAMNVANARDSHLVRLMMRCNLLANQRWFRYEKNGNFGGIDDLSQSVLRYRFRVLAFDIDPGGFRVASSNVREYPSGRIGWRSNDHRDGKIIEQQFPNVFRVDLNGSQPNTDALGCTHHSNSQSIMRFRTDVDQRIAESLLDLGAFDWNI